jgi:hypothetical protein
VVLHIRLIAERKNHVNLLGLPQHSGSRVRKHPISECQQENYGGLTEVTDMVSNNKKEENE